MTGAEIVATVSEKNDNTSRLSELTDDKCVSFCSINNNKYYLNAF